MSLRVCSFRGLGLGFRVFGVCLMCYIRGVLEFRVLVFLWFWGFKGLGILEGYIGYLRLKLFLGSGFRVLAFVDWCLVF